MWVEGTQSLRDRPSNLTHFTLPAMANLNSRERRVSRDIYKLRAYLFPYIRSQPLWIDSISSIHRYLRTSYINVSHFIGCFPMTKSCYISLPLLVNAQHQRGRPTQDTAVRTTTAWYIPQTWYLVGQDSEFRGHFSCSQSHVSGYSQKCFRTLNLM